jgi:hypothetical protein
MPRQAKKVGADVQRCFRRILALERDLTEAYAEGDWERAWKAAVNLKRVMGISERLMKEFLAAVSLRNPGSGKALEER